MAPRRLLVLARLGVGGRAFPLSRVDKVFLGPLRVSTLRYSVLQDGCLREVHRWQNSEARCGLRRTEPHAARRTGPRAPLNEP